MLFSYPTTSNSTDVYFMPELLIFSPFAKRACTGLVVVDNEIAEQNKTFKFSQELLILTEGLLWIHHLGKYLLRIMMVLVNGTMYHDHTHNLLQICLWGSVPEGTQELRQQDMLLCVSVC